MTPEDKALELVQTFKPSLAIEVVDEILKYQPFDIYTIEQSINVNNYWQEVKNVLQNL